MSRILFIVIFLTCFTEWVFVSGQTCSPTPTGCSTTADDPTCISPEATKRGKVNVPYNDFANFKVEQLFTYNGNQFTTRSMTIDSVRKLPAGLNISFQSGNPADGVGGAVAVGGSLTPASTDVPVYGCATFSGTPTAPTSITDSVTIYFSMLVTMNNRNYRFRGWYTVQIPIDPGDVLTVKATANPTTVVCGNTTRLTATASMGTGTTYTWSPTSGIFGSPNVASVTARPPATTVYTVTAKNGTQVAKDSIKITVNSEMGADFDATPTLMTAQPYTVQFNNKTPWQSGMQFFWDFGDGGTSTQYAPFYNYQAEGSYTVTLIVRRQGVTCADTALKANYIVIEPPLTLSFDSEPTIDCGASTALKPNLNKSDNATYVWSPATGLNNPNAASPTATPTVTTTYTLTVTRGLETVSESITVTVKPINLNLSFFSPDTVLSTPPYTARFTNTTPGRNIQYTWYFGDGTTSNQGNPTKTYQDPGSYTVKLVANRFGSPCRDSLVKVGYIRIDSGQNPTLEVTASADTGIFCNGSAKLTASSNLKNTTFKWSPSAGLNNANIANPTASPSSTTTYTVTATQGLQTATQTVTVSIKPAEIQGIEPAYCVTTFDIQWKGIPSGGTFSGPINGLTPDGAFNPSEAGTGNYMIRYAGTVNGCSFSTSVAVKVNAVPVADIGGLEYYYCRNSPAVTLTPTPPGGTLTLNGVPLVNNVLDPSKITDFSGMITYEGTSNGCAYLIQRYIQVTDPPKITIMGLNSFYCQNAEKTTLSGNPMGGTFSGPGVKSEGDSLTGLTWTFDPTLAPPGKVYIKYTVYPNWQWGGCTTSDSVAITIYPLPVIATTIVPSTLGMNNGSVTISASQGQAPYQYGFNGGALSTKTKYTGLKPGSYEVIAVDANGCSTTTKVTVDETADCSQAISAKANGNTSFCAGNSVELEATSGQGFTYQWLRNDAPIPGATQAKYLASTSGQYAVSVSRTGCPDAKSAALAVTAHAAPSASAQSTPTLTGKSTGSIKVSVQGGASPYQFKLGNNAESPDSVLKNLAAGSYTIVVKDKNGCTDTVQTQVSEVAPDKVWPGDANNDGTVDVGDYFFIAGAIGKTGPARTDRGGSWRAYESVTDWDSFSNYRGVLINNKYLDANGDGKIDAADADIAKLNRGLSR